MASQSAKWWDAEGSEATNALNAVVRHIYQRGSWRRQADELHAELYAGGPAAAGISLRARSAYDYEPCTLPYNVCRSSTDTVVAKIAKHRPLPQALTTRGDWTNQKRGRKLSQFLEGQFYRSRIFEGTASRIVRDACVFGRGLLKVFVEHDTKSVGVERTQPWEVMCDDWDARYGEPRNLYHVRTVDKGVLFEQYAPKRDPKDGEDLTREQEEFKVKLDAASASGLDDVDWFDEQDSTVDRVRIVEAWHLPSVKGAKNGKHIICTLGGDLMLLEEEWKRDYFPFAILQYSDPLSGFWGQGIVEQAEGFQYEVNEMSTRVSEGHHMLGGGIILTPLGSDIIDTAFHNGVVPIIKHQPGKPPQFVTPAPIHPATYQRLRDLVTDTLNSVGVSQMSSMSAKPPGIESGIALQTMDDIETERFIIFGRAYEAWCLDVARQMVDCAKDIAKEYGDYSVGVPMKGGMLELSWSDVSLDSFELKVFSTSILPTQPAAKLDRANTLFNAGVIDRATFLRLLDAPDLSAELDMETADRLNIDERLELMLDADGDVDAAYKMPTSYQNYRWGQRRAQQKLNRAEIDGAPDENLELLRRYITDCQALIDQETGNAGAGAPPPPGPPPDLSAMQPTTTPAGMPGQMPMAGAPPPPPPPPLM